MTFWLLPTAGRRVPRLPEYTQVAEDTYDAVFPANDWRESYRTRVHVTRERSWPGLKWGEIHAPLYRIAAEAITRETGAGSYVVDAGCGSGYGTQILFEGGHAPYGVDVDEQAVSFAAAAYGRFTYREGFGHGDFAYFAPSGGGGTYDAVVCVEVIEHVDREHGQRMLQNAARLLRPGGLLFLTTPDIEAPGYSPGNPFHVHEYSAPELFDALADAGFTHTERHRVTEFMESIVMTARRK